MQKPQAIATWNKARDLWETSQIDIFGHSDVYAETWPKSGMTRGGQLFESPSWEGATTAQESSSSRSLPTPKASDGIMGRPRTTGRPIEKSTHLGTIVTLLPTPNTMDSLPAREGEARERQLRRGDPNGSRRKSMGNLREDIVAIDLDGAAEIMASKFGPYAEAVQRWEQVTRPAPDPTQPNTKGKPQLAAPFAEWMMGLPEWWVTSEEIGLTRTQQLKAIGNGVCPQQAEAALRHLLGEEQ